MNRYGPAGIPLSSKGRTIKDGIEDVHMMGLNAIEIQMIRNFVEQRPPEDFEIGMRPEEVRSSFIVEVGKPIGDDYVYTSTGKEIMEEDDLLTVLHVPSVGVNYMELRAMGKLARMLDVRVAVHSQYYIDLISNEEITYRSLDNIMWSGVVAREIGADLVITHLGPYGDTKKKEAMKRVKENLRAIVHRFRENGITAMIGVETSGKQELLGTMNEVIAIARDVEGVVPLLNYAHIHSREDGSLKTPEDFKKLFQKIRKYVGTEIYGHFSGVEYDKGNETRATPIKKGDLKFEPLAEAMLESEEDFVLICDSPLLEHDAMYMKVITERTLSKKISREKREMEKLALEREKEEEERQKHEAEAAREAEKKKKEDAKKAATPPKEEKKEEKITTKKKPEKKSPSKSTGKKQAKKEEKGEKAEKPVETEKEGAKKEAEKKESSKAAKNSDDKSKEEKTESAAKSEKKTAEKKTPAKKKSAEKTGATPKKEKTPAKKKQTEKEK